MLRRLLICTTFLAASFVADAQLSLVTVATGLNNPLFVTAPPGDMDRLFIVERTGAIKILVDGAVFPTPYLQVTVASSGEGGLLGMAFHPDYASNGRFYVNYTAADPFRTHISEFTVSGNPATSNVADPLSEVVLLQIVQPFTNHNGGMIAFSPIDEYLYIGMGDGGAGNDPSNAGQRLDTLLAKMLRIHVPGNGTYSIPADNPFIGQVGALPEIWAIGLRNPFRFSFDRLTGDMYIGDVGQLAREEIHFQAASSTGGENYGWRIFEGTRCNVPPATQLECDALAPTAIPPIYEYENPPTEPRAVMGGYVYRGSAIHGLSGTYFFSDSSYSRIWSLRYSGTELSEFTDHTEEMDPEGSLLANIVSFGEDGAGEMYVVSITKKAVYKITGTGEAGPLPDILGPSAVEEGETAVFRVLYPEGPAEPVYQWIKNEQAMPGETNATLVLEALDAEDSGTYRVLVSDASKASYLSPPFQFAVVAAGTLPISSGIAVGLMSFCCALGGLASLKRRTTPIKKD